MMMRRYLQLILRLCSGTRLTTYDLQLTTYDLQLTTYNLQLTTKTSMTKYIKYIKRKWANVSFARHITVRLDRCVVTFTFDDVPVSAFENGRAILTRYGFMGTFYLALSFMDGREAENRFTLQDMKKALIEQHELACHTRGHIDLSQTRFEDSVRDIEQNQEQLMDLLPGNRFKNFSYPFGAQTRAVKKYLSEHYRSARGIGHGLNVGETDLYNLKTVKLYENRMPLEEIFRLMDEAAEQRAWLVFYTHDVADEPSEYGCSPAYFEAVVAECARRQLDVLTVDKALDLIESKQDV